MARPITYARELLEYEAKETERLRAENYSANKILCGIKSHGRNAQQDIALFLTPIFLFAPHLDTSRD
jgi:hypothetical protein